MDTQVQSPSTDYASVIEAYGSYPFNTDETYQQGLQSIISAGSIDMTAPESVREELIRRTRVFYFNQTTGNNISMEDATRVELARDQTMQPSSESDETRVLSFAELKELIESGNMDKIPNNKVIPEAINDAAPSESVTPARKKPWEIIQESATSNVSDDSMAPASGAEMS